MKKHFLITTMFVMHFAHFLVGTDSNPTMSRVYGNQYIPAIQQTQNSGLIGTLVPTGIFGTNGSLSLAAQVPNAQAVAIELLPTGVMAVVFNDGTNTYMVEYTAQGSVYTSFAAGSNNILELPGLANSALSLLVDEQNRFLLFGQDDASSLPWVRRISQAGVVDTNFAFVDGSSWTSNGFINQLATQTSGKIIVAGSNGAYSMIARYNLDGSIDSSFGSNGYVILNGATSGGGILPISQTALRNIVIDAQNNMYLTYATATPSVYVIRLTSSGILDSSWNSGNPVNLSYLDGSSMVIDQLCMVLDALGDLIVAVPSGNPTIIKAASIRSADGLPGTFANFSTSEGVFGSDNYELSNMMTTSDGNIYFLGSDLTMRQMAIIRCTNTGDLDLTFNETGCNFFYPTGSMPTSYGYITSGSIAPDGQIFVAGAQLDVGITTPYVSSLYNNQYVTTIGQFPATQEQGTTDISFGLSSIQTAPGVVSPFIGLYRANLEQKVEAVTELASGNILIGMNGYTGVSPSLSDMMLVRLLPTGVVDGTFGLAGNVVLPNITGTNEYITNILEDGSANLYITGYSDVGAIFRKYTSTGMLLWNSDYLVAGYKGLGCGFEGITRALLFLGGPSDTGQINAYSVNDGSVDLSFHALGSHPGEILTDDFGLNMGSLYNGIVDVTGNIFIAYKDTQTQAINVVSIFNAGLAVIWTHEDVFSTTSIAAGNVRVSFNNDGNIVVAASAGTDFFVTVLNVANGNPTSLYTTPLIIPCGAAIQLKQVIGISNDTIVLVGYDGTGDAMLAARISATGTVDITFDSQGPFPGVAAITIGNQITHYYARVASGITVQSHAGSNQGNLIMSGYEQMFATDSTPMVMRVFGAPGTTQVKNSPVTAKIPGTFDISYNGTGVAETEIVDPDITNINQEVRSIRELIGTQIMTVITDNNTSLSYTQRLNSDSSVDTTYGGGQSVPIAQLAGTETVQSMVFDGSGNFLISGSNSSSGGYVKRLLPDGTMDQLFGGYNGNSNSSLYPLGTTYGLMDTVNACQSLANGNIIIVGSSNGVGTIQQLSISGQPVLSFGAGGQITSGINATSVSVDPSNNAYVSIVDFDGNQNNVRILKLNATTGEFVTDFGNNGVIDGAIVNIDNSQSLRLVFDSALRPIVAASFGSSSGQVAVNRFTANGLVDTSFNNGVQAVIPFNPATYVVVTGIAALQNNKILVSGYQQDDMTPARNQEFIACIDEFGLLDGSFGSGNPAGLVTFQVADSVQLARRLINMNVQADGNILLCGGEVPAVDEETPLTFRLYGYPYVQAVPQSSGYVSTLPTVLNTSFNGSGIAVTPVIDNLVQVGNVAVDSLGHALIGGVTSTGFFVVARYLRNGLLDTIENGGAGFGIGGIAMSIVPIVGLSGGEIAVDSADNIYIGGVASSHQLLVARFLPTGVLDTAHFGSGGIAASTSIQYLFSGGFVTVDADNKPVVSGYTSTGTIVVIRFLINGTMDTSFAQGTNYIASIFIPSLLSGGSMTTDHESNLYIGGITSTYTMFVINLNHDGTLNTQAFGINGIASTSVITGLIDGGAVALDGNNNIVVGGLTANQTFVVAKFLPIGDADPAFNPMGSMPGIVYSNPVNILNVFGNIAVDSSNNIVIGGVARNYNESQSMIVARFTSTGSLDTVFTSIGMATTGDLFGVTAGGYVITDTYDNIFVGGLTDVPGFIIAQMYSGEEIFITDIALLNPPDLKTFYYGNNPVYVTQVLGAEYFAQVITNASIRQVVLATVASTLAEFVLIYENQPGWNLVWHLYRQLNSFEEDRAALIILFAAFTDQINNFYVSLDARINGLKFSS